MSKDEAVVAAEHDDTPVISNTSSTALARIRTVAIITLQTALVLYAIMVSGIFTMFAIRRANGNAPLAVLYGSSSFLMNVFLALFFGKRVEKFALDVYNERAHKKQLLALFSFAFFSATATTTAGVQVAHDATKLLRFPTPQMIATILFCFNTATTRFVGAYDLPKRIFMSTASHNSLADNDFSLTIKKIFKVAGGFAAFASLLLVPMWSGLTQDGIEKLDSHLSKKWLSAYTFIALLSNPLFYAVSCFDAPKNIATLVKECHDRLQNVAYSAVAATLFVTLGVASGSGYSKEMATMLARSFGSVFNEIISDKHIQEVYEPIHAAYITMLIVGIVNMNGTAAFFVRCLETEKKYDLSFARAILVYLGFSKVESDAILPVARSVADRLGSADTFERQPSSPFLSQVGDCFKTAIASCCCALFRKKPDNDVTVSPGLDPA